MTLQICHFDNLNEAIFLLETLALKKHDYIFRGHTKESHKLATTLSRHRSIPHESWSSDIDNMIDMFRVGLAKLDILPFASEDRQDWLEYARHHGVPTPALDFSYSPYVSLFFAFDDVRRNFETITSEYAAVYAVSISKLAWVWATLFADPTEKYDEVMAKRHAFLYPPKNLFEHGFPGPNLQFIPFPGKYNKRMHRQQGALLYDTLNYQHLGVSDLDELIGNHKEQDTGLPDGSVEKSDLTAYKICINKNCVSEVFSRLELMGINGGALYLTADGVAQDVSNSYNYNSKTSYLRDIQFPDLDDTKI